MKKTITLSIASIFTLGLMSFVAMDPDGKTNRTGGHGESGCTCHSSALNNGVAISVTASGSLFSAGYVSDVVYTIDVTVAEGSQPLFGFDFQALNSANESVGTLTAGTSGDNKVSGSPLVNVVHTGNGNSGSGTHTFSFTWTAPAVTTGAVTFYYSGLAANGNGGDDSGDHWNKGSTIINPSTVGIEEYTSSDFNLSIFPNPVNESANISYALAEKSVVSASLMNIKGQVVANFFDNEEHAAGSQSRKLEMNSSIAKGMYFVVINVNGMNNYKRIVVE